MLSRKVGLLFLLATVKSPNYEPAKQAKAQSLGRKP
jgi:hypothetical protein